MWRDPGKSHTFKLARSAADVALARVDVGGRSRLWFVMGRPRMRLEGLRFGRLVVVRFLDVMNDNARFVCRCDCGALLEARGSHLKSGNIRSCGCIAGVAHSKHGHASSGKPSPTYVSWMAMRARCSDLSNERYGARGISVCEQWSSFERFLKDMGKRPVGMTIDRVDGDGNYGPGNCRWATPETQASNRRPVKRKQGECLECTRDAKSRNLCRVHYMKHWRAGTLPPRIYRKLQA